MKKENIKNLEAWLEERFNILNFEDSNKCDEEYLKGAITALMYAGYEVHKTTNGVKIFKL